MKSLIHSIIQIIQYFIGLDLFPIFTRMYDHSLSEIIYLYIFFCLIKWFFPQKFRFCLIFCVSILSEFGLSLVYYDVILFHFLVTA